MSRISMTKERNCERKEKENKVFKIKMQRHTHTHTHTQYRGLYDGIGKTGQNIQH